MDSLSRNIFQQARLLVAQADREMAEVAVRFEEAFPLSREEKEALRPSPVDAFDRWSVELAPADGAATFLITPAEGGVWALDVVERGKGPQALGSFQAGSAGSTARARLRAARVLAAIGDYIEQGSGKQGAVEMETVLVMEASARMEIKSESRPKVQTAAPQQPQVLEGKVEDKALPVIQPRWLDLLPGAQEMAPEQPLALAAGAEKESRAQSMKLGKIFGF